MSGTGTLQPINAISQFVNGTQATWNSITVPIPAGLIIYATDTTAVKVGDGTNLYANLPTAFTISDILTLTSTVNTLSSNLTTTNASVSTLQTNYNNLSSTVSALQSSVSAITYTSTTSTAGNVVVASTEYYIGIANTTPAATTVTLPAAPVDNERHVIKDVNGVAQTYNITVLGNGNNIDGASQYVMNTNYEALSLFFTNGAWAQI